MAFIGRGGFPSIGNDNIDGIQDNDKEDIGIIGVMDIIEVFTTTMCH